MQEQSGEADYIRVDSLEGIITLVQFGVVELHPWGSAEGSLDTPDQLTFDLDPAEGVAWKAVIRAAQRVRELLGDSDLESFVKLSGGKGLHVVVPLKPQADWDEAKAFCRAVAEQIVAESPGDYIATASKARRRGKIFIDYLRNAQGATSVAAYSARARASAPVAVPLRWEDLGRTDSSASYTIETLGRRLARLRQDPWDGYSAIRQRLTAKRIAAFQKK